MNTCQTLGTLGAPTGGPCEYLTLVFSPLSTPLRSRWRNNGLSADFVSDYVTTFLPIRDDLSFLEVHQKAIRHAVSYVANELLENAMKYHQANVDTPIRIHLALTSEHITVTATNGVGSPQASVYKEYVTKLLAGEPEEMLMAQMEAVATGSTSSSVGLLTMMNDYGAQLGWRFDIAPELTDTVAVTTTATLSLKRISGVAA
jgi:hypothetical protein